MINIGKNRLESGSCRGGNKGGYGDGVGGVKKVDIDSNFCPVRNCCRWWWCGWICSILLHKLRIALNCVDVEKNVKAGGGGRR
jgi:hypothetical protein